MALSRPALSDPYDNDELTAFVLMYQLHMEQLHLQAEIDELDEELRQMAMRRKLRMLAIMRLCSRERHVWSYHRSSSWYDTTLPNLPDSTFRENFRVSRSTFAYIVNACECMRRRDTNMRQAIPLDKRVAIGLYRLASSAEERTVAHLFGVSRPSVNLIFREFCRVVVQRLEHLYIRFPQPCELAEHLRQFEAVLGFPQGVGALDGCHLEVCPPKDNASDYYNYKGWYSIILLAVADHNYKFLSTSVGSPGKNHDANVFRRSKLPRNLASPLFSMEAKTVEGVHVCPLLLGDQAFPLQTHLMKPFPRPGPAGTPSQIFNYRLSSARRVIENAFGRLKARFRMMHKGLECDIHNVNSVVRAACVLHNICEHLRDQCDTSWVDAVRCDDERRPQPDCRSNRRDPLGVAVREALAQHLAKSR